MAPLRLIRALRRETVDRTPVWFMRQAGRYLPEYRELRSRNGMLELCRNAELAAEATLQPVRRFPDLDAAILFSDLLFVLQPMGFEIEFLPSEGPAVRNPVRAAKDVDTLRPVEPGRDLAPVLEAIRIVRRELGDRIPLLGFGGAPFTLASYVVEGGASKDYRATKSLMASEPELWNRLLARLTDAVVALLRAQVSAGAQALQIFDSWAGALSPDDYREHVLPHSKRLFHALTDLGVPLIHFSTGTSGLLELLKEAGGDAIGIDWRVPLDAAWNRLGAVAIQGNLDPAALLAPEPVLLRRVDEVLARAGGRPGHIFNLGHGVLPETPPDRIAAVIERVHERTAT